MTGTKQHRRGTVEANIVKSNIPVQNGIVHLIDKPLVIMANTLYEHLCIENAVQVGINKKIVKKRFSCIFFSVEIYRIFKVPKKIS